MFKNEDILEFLTKIVKNSNSTNIEESKESIEKFKEYLILTTMCDENTLKSITKVVSCFEELVNIYQKTGVCDLTSIFNPKEKNPILVKVRTFDKPYQKKHYDRYISTSGDYGSSCGSSSSRGSSGSSCGSGGSYGSRC